MSGFFKSLEVGLKMTSSVLLVSESISHESAGAGVLLGLLSIVPLAWSASTWLCSTAECTNVPDTL